jgi:hypothetical protein
MRLNNPGRNVATWQITANLADIQLDFGRNYVISCEIASKNSPFGPE